MYPNRKSDPIDRRVIIVGSGHAGVHVADALRARGHRGPITLIGDEPVLPYQRPPLSKEYLAPQAESTGQPLHGRQYFVDHEIDLHIGVTATAVERTARLVSLSSGHELPYDVLVLATGTAHRRLAVPGANLDGIYSLRTLSEAESLRSALTCSRSVLIVGAGFIGLEVAAAARKRGLEVTILEAADRPLGRVLSDEMASHLTAAHRQRGIDLRFGEVVERFTGEEGRVTGAVSTAGVRYQADLVLVAIGVTPRTELAVQAGLPATEGITVDENLRTADESIYAVGDCACHPNIHAGTRMRLESIQNATDQGRHVASMILGDAHPYSELPWFWSCQGELKLQIAGVRRPGDHNVIVGNPDSGRFSVCCYRDGRLIAVESLNRPADHVAARHMLTAGQSPGPEQLCDPAFTLKDFAKNVVAVH